MDNMIEVKNLNKNFITHKRGGSLTEAVTNLFHRKEVVVEAVKDITFSVKKGELLGFLGPNGAGKSTTIKMLTGTLFPTSGQIIVNGYVPYKERIKYVKNIGAVFGQKSQLIWDIPPIDSFLMNKAIYDLDTKTYKRNLEELVELLKVNHIIEKPTRVLSLGERMKCEFIMAMLHNPEIVFLDEPTIGLDIIAKESVRTFIKDMNKRGVTFVLTTHDVGDIELLAERIIVINNGSIVFDNSLQKFKGYLGSSKQIYLTMNTPIENFSLEGLSVLKKVSDFEFSLELNLEKNSIQKALQYINGLGEIADISIKELPIERVIKALYKE